MEQSSLVWWGKRLNVTESSADDRAEQWRRPGAVELFAATRFGKAMTTAAEVEAEVVQRLCAKDLPKSALARKVKLCDAILPRRGEDFAQFAAMYERVCMKACARNEVDTAAPYRAACSGSGADDECHRLRSGSDIVEDAAAPHRAACSGSGAGDECHRLRSGSDIVGDRENPTKRVGETEREVPTKRAQSQRETEREDPTKRAEREDPTKRVEHRLRSGWGEDIENQLQRKLLGFLLARIHEAQDFMSVARSYELQTGSLSDLRQVVEKNRRMVRINDMLRPWVGLLAQVANHTQLNRMQEIWNSQKGIPTPEVNRALVYARVNLLTQDLYIGETKSWDSRVKQHFTACYKHSDQCAKPCKGCKEHTKYQKHRVCAPHEWIMIPLYECAGKYEALRLERKLVKRWKPSLNQGDRPFWLLKQAYATDFRRGRNQQRDRKPPWKSRLTDRETPIRAIPALTTYETEGRRYLDINDALGMSMEGVRIKITRGVMDLTRWPGIRQKFGDSYVKVQYPDGTRESTRLSLWCMDRKVDWFHVWIKPEISEHEPETDSSVELLNEIEHLEEVLEKSSEEDLACYWRTRNNLDKQSKIKMRQIIWNECERRYEGLTRVPLTVRIPYFEKLQAHLVRREICAKINAQEGWPEFLRAWHCQRLRIVTASQPSIDDILVNVNKPWYEKKGCKCMEVKQRLREAGYQGSLPMTEGHVLLTGREYDGPWKAALNVCASNVPTQTAWDLQRAWERAREQLPEVIQGTQTQWKAALRRVCDKDPSSKGLQGGSMFPVTREVYKLRKAMHGMVIGPLDKNKGELWCCCPNLYMRALESMYNEQTGYETVETAEARGPTPMADWLVEGHPPGFGPKGRVKKRKKEDDLARKTVRKWQAYYKERGWQRYATFNAKGGFNKPYVLLKSKNMAPEVRAAKWKKARPIAPGTRHPMRKLLGLVGRAWSFATARMEGEHFVLNHGGLVPAFLKEAEQLRAFGEIDVIIRDIEGCYPNMPKETIRWALRRIAKDLEEKHGYGGVTVPKWSPTKACSWKPPKNKGAVFIPWQVMLDVMEFSLDNALIEAPEGGKKLLRQVSGIPMGDPISPGMTVGTCAWMENEWMTWLSAKDKEMFRAKRYMDDILLIFSKNPGWDYKKFVADFERSECYQAPLTLEEGGRGTFLETTFELQANGTFRHHLKNENNMGERPKIWRYTDWRSHGRYEQKRALITGRMRAVHKMASDKLALRQSALQKLNEFKRLGYPPGLLRGVCNFMGATTGEGTWIGVRNAIT